MTSLFSYKYRRKLDRKLTDYVYDKINHIPYIAYIVIFFHAMFFISLLTDFQKSDILCWVAL